MDRTVNTLFMLMSVDGKISTGATDDYDVDSDLPRLPGVAEGLPQYYELERQTDLWSCNSARVLVKIGYNERTTAPPDRSDVSFILVDNAGHFNATAIRYLAASLRRVVIATTRPAYDTYGCDNVDVISYGGHVDFADLFRQIRSRYGAERVTIQTGGTLNGVLLRAGLIDFVHVVVAPVLVGGADVVTLVDGPNPRSLADLGVLRLVESRALDHSYLFLKYAVHPAS
ncbi:MAG: dihydrofolate reductase family protein [Propionibacteriaceae bacterium]|jgi:2,5-diamino-6-(ribosylamino)-4(3H)-pyrimidinone 5'-phosphate reductase|nr:dihydrofolate reductase family protein [Propionibacteriaceae bacterium]